MHDQYKLSAEDEQTVIESHQHAAIERRRGPLSPTRVAIVAILTICIATYFLFMHGAVDRAHLFREGDDRGGGDDPSVSHTPDWSSSNVPQCAKTEPVAPVDHRDNVWSMLTVGEAVQIHNWLFEDALGLNLTRGDAAVMK